MAPDNIQNILDRLSKVRAVGSNQWEAVCPAHDDRRASLSIGIGNKSNVVLHCHAGCTAGEVVTKIGLRLRDLFAPDAAEPGRRVVATYDYRDASGTLVYQVRRHEPKHFDQRRPDGKGGWIYDMKGVGRLLYRLPELLASFGPVLIVEGEKDVDLLLSLGFNATCNSGGAGKWQADFAAHLAGREVVIIADKDAAGRKHGQVIQRTLPGSRVVEVPGDGKDVSDFIVAGGDPAELLTLAPTTLPATEVDDNAPTDLQSLSRLLTDTGNAARFSIQHADAVRFCHPWGKWLIYASGVWRVDERGKITELATRTAISIFDEAKNDSDPDRREKIGKWAVKSQGRDRLSAMLELAKCRLSILPSDFDKDRWLLNVQNGTVDLRDGTIRPHRREDYITKICNAAYDPHNSCPEFLAFLDRIFQTYPTLIQYMQKVFGYSLTGLIVEQVMFFLHGDGSNGKTTLLDAIMHVMGDYAGKADREILSASDRGNAQHPTNVADLQGKRLATCSETNDGVRLDEAKLKDLVGETRMKARLMFKDFFEFETTHKIFLFSNHRPTIRGTDYGVWRRMRLIPFVETITPEEKDPYLPQKLIDESGGILTWMVQGCMRWQEEGLGLPDEVAQATNSYRVEMDSVGTFIDERCDYDPSYEVSASELYQAYRKFCEERGEYPFTQTRFGRQLSGRPRIEKSRTSTGQIYRGIALKFMPATGM